MIVITDKTKCCGCSACGDVCPKMAISFKADKEGFLYPVVDLTKCVDCHLCEKVCPFMNVSQPRKPQDCYAAINPNIEERIISSSGGVFFSLIKQIIEDGGIVFGASFDGEWSVCHSSADTIEDCAKFLGSKYVQSRMDGCYIKVRDALILGKKVLFSGTACQIAGLKNYLGKRKDSNNLITVDVVCHGVPSPGVWKKYLSFIIHNQKEKLRGEKRRLSNGINIESISFRDKHYGWRNFSFALRYSVALSESTEPDASTHSHVLLETKDDNIFIQGFLHNLYLRPSCHHCLLRSGRCNSDITLGDFWGIWNELPVIDDDKGVSLLLVNTERGRSFLKRTSVKLWDVNYEQGVRYNPCLEDSVPESKWRSIFMDEFAKGGINAIHKVIRQMKPSMFSRIIRRLKRVIRL